MKRRFIVSTVVLLLSVTGLWAQNSGFSAKLSALGQHLDSSAVRKYDSRYIEVPDRPWRVILRSKMDENIVDFVNSNTIKYEGTDVNTRLSLKFDSELNKSIGVWIGYRGLGFGYYY